MSVSYAGLPSTQRRVVEEQHAEYVLMCRALSVIYFVGIGFIALWAALLDGFDLFALIGILICLGIAGAALMLANYRVPKRMFVLPLLVGVAMQLVLVLHYQQNMAGFFLLLPAIYCVLFFWTDRAVLIPGMLLITATFIAEPLLVGGDAVVARIVMTTPIFLCLVFATGYLGHEAARMDRKRGRFESTISSLLVALQERDGYTADHSEETVELAMAVGERLKMKSDDLATLADVALLHDIGKIGIPNEILNKTDGLDEHEWEFMKRHPEIGERIVAPVPGFADVAKAIRHEHERWDGAGYPDGLVGEQIPLPSRIVLVCDAYHAMITDRPYRKAIGEVRAREELEAHSGSQFDPQVVDALLAVIDDGAIPESVGRAAWVPDAQAAGAA